METFSTLLALCEGTPVTRSFDDFFYLRLHKRLSKIETPVILDVFALIMTPV